MDSAGAHLRHIREALDASRAVPLSVRNARVVAALLDVMPDRAYSAWRGNREKIFDATDRADYRERVLARSHAMAQIAALFAEVPSARLSVEALHIPAEEARSLSVGDLMVSLYNDRTVPRLMIVHDDGTQVLADTVFEDAVAFWEARVASLPALVFSHVMVGANDPDTMVGFYDAVLRPLGLKRASYVPNGDPAGVIWKRKGARWPQFALRLPYDGLPASAGNGIMIGFAAPSRMAVDAAWDIALAHGGVDEGAPGIRDRYSEDFYAAYCRDPEGNMLCFVHADGL